MRIVFLAVDDEFAGAMQGEMYRRRPEWIVGSVLSRHSIFSRYARASGGMGALSGSSKSS